MSLALPLAALSTNLAMLVEVLTAATTAGLEGAEGRGMTGGMAGLGAGLQLFPNAPRQSQVGLC